MCNSTSFSLSEQIVFELPVFKYFKMFREIAVFGFLKIFITQVQMFRKKYN